jgi:hypothetical protein
VTRYEQPVEITLTPDQAAHLLNNGRPADSSQLSVRVYGGRLTARWPARTGFDNPPRFAGQVQQGSAGASVAGSIRESLANTLWSRIMLAATLVMGALAIFGAVLLITNGAHYGLPPLLIGVLAGPLAALLWRRLRRLRRPNFDADAERLRVGLARYLISGDGTRRSN